MKTIFLLVLFLTSLAQAEVYEANSDGESKLAVTWTIEPMVFEKEYQAGYVITNKKNAQLEGQVSNQTACIRKKGQLIGRTILHRYEIWDAGIDRRALATRVISTCKFPELK